MIMTPSDPDIISLFDLDIVMDYGIPTYEESIIFLLRDSSNK